MLDMDALAAFVRSHVEPQALDIEQARRVILEHLSQLPPEEYMRSEESGGLIDLVRQRLYGNPVVSPWTGIEIKPDMNEAKADLVAREALQSLHARGVIVAVRVAFVNTNDEVRFSYNIPRRGGSSIDIIFFRPVVQFAYRLATEYRGETFRLASAGLYLTGLNQAYLPTRARRCLEESIRAFQYGLYLSATMNAGAASESMWLHLARQVEKVTPGDALTRALNARYMNIATVIDSTWQALQSHCADKLGTLFSGGGERDAFKQHADRLREHRNYAMHSGEADEEEPRFTYNETGMLLLDAADYFRALTELLAIFTPDSGADKTP